ncbi:MAG: DUF4249 family protein [Candidatus Cloacimonetes bacterium]|nr:DUF4249 family protein [Candidatus Cloacimonadota bacterium]
MKNMFLLLAGVLILGSCSENTSGMRYETGNYYVSCLLKAGAFIDGENSVKVGKTQDIENAQWDMLADSTAQVKIKEISPNSTVTGEVLLTWKEELRAYIDADGVMPINEKNTYELEVVTKNGQIITASTTVPQAIEVLGDSQYSEEPVWAFEVIDDEWLELELETADAEHPVQIRTLDDEEFNLYTEFWCLEDVENAEYTFPEGDNDYPADNEEYMGDTHQYPRRLRNFFMFQPENGIVNYNSYQADLKFYGRFRMKVYSIDENYLSYLYKADGYEHGGIEGGIGVFGSCCGRELYTRVVK